MQRFAQRHPSTMDGEALLHRAGAPHPTAAPRPGSRRGAGGLASATSASISISASAGTQQAQPPDAPASWLRRHGLAVPPVAGALLASRAAATLRTHEGVPLATFAGLLAAGATAGDGAAAALDAVMGRGAHTVPRGVWLAAAAAVAWARAVGVDERALWRVGDSEALAVKLVALALWQQQRRQQTQLAGAPVSPQEAALAVPLPLPLPLRDEGAWLSALLLLQQQWEEEQEEADGRSSHLAWAGGYLDEASGDAAPHAAARLPRYLPPASVPLRGMHLDYPAYAPADVMAVCSLVQCVARG